MLTQVLSQTSEQACHSFYSCIFQLIGSLTLGDSGQNSNAAFVESSSPKGKEFPFFEWKEKLLRFL